MTVVTLATIPACLAVVTLLRDLGMRSRYAALAAVVTGIVLSLLDTFTLSTAMPDYHAILYGVASGFILGLSASGLYDTSRLVGHKKTDTLGMLVQNRTPVDTKIVGVAPTVTVPTVADPPAGPKHTAE